MISKCLKFALFAITLGLMIGGPEAEARPARGKVLLQQADGSYIGAILTGDEYCHVLTDEEGHALVQGEDGFYFIARYNVDGSIVNTGYRADGKAAPGHQEGAAPSHVLGESMVIPYSALNLRAAQRRSATAGIAATRAQTLAAARSAARLCGPAGASGITPSATPIQTACAVVYAAYSDIAFTYSRESMGEVFNKPNYSYGGATGSVIDYFEEQLGGEYSFYFGQGPVVTLPGKQKYYGGNDSMGNDKNPAKAVYDACQLAHDAGFNFADYDMDGDGEVDNVFVIVSGKDEADGGGEDAIWAHQWYLDAAGMRLELDGKRINCYTICSELAYRMTNKLFLLTTIGSICHEYGHSLGLMDMYDTDGDEGGSTIGLRETSVMDAGCYNNDSNTPPHYNAIDYDTLGAGDMQELTLGSHTLDPIGNGRRYYKISKPDEPLEYFLIEYRDGKGWDAPIAGSGLAVYHVDRSKRKAGYSSTYGMTFTASQRWWYNEVNARSDNMCAAFVPAKKALSNQANLFFPCGTIDFVTPESSTPLSFFDGTPAPLVLTGIRIENGKACFDAVDAENFMVPAIEEIGTDVYQHTAIIRVVPERSGFGGKCIVNVALAGSRGKDLEATQLSDGSFVLRAEDLKPGKTYSYSVYLALASMEGDKVKGSFKTDDEGGSQPYICLKGASRNSDGSFRKGSRIPLDVYDVPAAEIIRWRLDGNTVWSGEDGYLYLENSGILTATIFYSGNDSETISKKIIVK